MDWQTADTILHTLAYSFSHDNIVYRSIYRLLYESGVRPNELQIIESWNTPGPNKYTFMQPKNDRPRTITIPSNLYNTLQNTPYLKLRISRRSQSTLRRYNKKYNELSTKKIKNKKVQLYVFRHNLIHKMLRAGKTDQEIMQEFNWATTSAYNQYKNSVLLD